MFPLLLMTLHEMLCHKELLMLLAKKGGISILFCMECYSHMLKMLVQSPSVLLWEKSGEGDASHAKLNAVILSFIKHTALFPQTDMNANSSYFRETTSRCLWHQVLSSSLFIYHFWLSSGREAVLAPRLGFVPVPTPWCVQVLLHSATWWHKAVLRVFD